MADYRTLNIKAGDTVLFKRGSFIRGKLENIEGEEGKPVTYGAYGEGDLPTFCGSVNLTDEALWKEESENVWVCTSDDVGEAANFIFNKSDLCGALKWAKEELSEQGDFFDTHFGTSNTGRTVREPHKIYLYSAENPTKYYSDIECVVYGARRLANTGKNIVFENLRFWGSGVHAIAGEGVSRNLKVKNCRFEYIGGAVFDYDMKVRLGNGIECWNYAENAEVTGCYFNNIYDSAVTHQGGTECEPANGFIIDGNIMIKCGMAAYEQRDIMPMCVEFKNNTCIDAGEGFSKNGEIMPRNSEIWPQPMGHHIFLWRVEEPTENGKMVIENNVFYNAPYGAAIYSIMSEKAEQQLEISGNTYYTENDKLLNRIYGRNFECFEQYAEAEPGAVYAEDGMSDKIRDII